MSPRESLETEYREAAEAYHGSIVTEAGPEVFKPARARFLAARSALIAHDVGSPKPKGV